MKYAPGLMVGQLSGSTGSTVASHNKFGSYFRSRTIPVNPNSSAQQGVRNTFAAISQEWRNLTQLERDAWIAAALSITLYDPLGVAYNPTGAQYFMSINQGVKLYSPTAAFSTAPPAPAPPTAPATLTPTITTSGESLAFTASPLGAGVKMVVEATRSISPGRKFIGRSEYKQVYVSSAAATSPLNIAGGYEAVFGAPIVGLNVAVRAFTLLADGQRSAPAFAIIDVT